ncbi:hypothetical protein B0H19DRAFT_1079687 [Mycena capillaripes]|nr:hypothetical protein B0H19DRAFT_1079687 [Mycena capillaripes]
MACVCSSAVFPTRLRSLGQFGCMGADDSWYGSILVLLPTGLDVQSHAARCKHKAQVKARLVLNIAPPSSKSLPRGQPANTPESHFQMELANCTKLVENPGDNLRSFRTLQRSATDPRRTASPLTPDFNTDKPIADPPKSPRIARQTAVKPVHVIVRFDKSPELLPRPLRTNRGWHEAKLYGAISSALLPLFDNSTNVAHMKDVLAGVHWTKSRNLALHPTETCTARFLIAQSDTIWTAICPLLHLPDDSGCPVLETDEMWHSVVFHGVPMPAPSAHALTRFTWDFVEEWVTTPGRLRECAVLCRLEELSKKASLALHLSFSSEADAERLVRDGGYIYGVPCRVSHYIPKARSPSPTPYLPQHLYLRIPHDLYAPLSGRGLYPRNQPLHNLSCPSCKVFETALYLQTHIIGHLLYL